MNFVIMRVELADVIFIITDWGSNKYWKKKKHYLWQPKVFNEHSINFFVLINGWNGHAKCYQASFCRYNESEPFFENPLIQCNFTEYARDCNTNLTFQIPTFFICKIEGTSI